MPKPKNVKPLTIRNSTVELPTFASQPPTPVPIFPLGSIIFDDERVADMKTLPILDTMPTKHS